MCHALLLDMGLLEGKKAWRELGWAGDDIPTSSNEIKALASCGDFFLYFSFCFFLLSGTRSKSNIYLVKEVYTCACCLRN